MYIASVSTKNHMFTGALGAPVKYIESLCVFTWRDTYTKEAANDVRGWDKPK